MWHECVPTFLKVISCYLNFPVAILLGERLTSQGHLAVIVPVDTPARTTFVVSLCICVQLGVQ